MTPGILHLQRSQIEEATGATRAEVLGWRPYIRFPLANDAPGKAMRYSLLNGIEYALLKLGVSRGVPHQVMSDFIAARLGYAIARADAHRLGLTSSVISNPAAWLEGSEFDVLAEPWFTNSPLDSAAFWTFDPTNNFRAESLHDLYEKKKEWGPRLKAEVERLGKAVDARDTLYDPVAAVEGSVFASVMRGRIVLEIRGPIRSLYAFAYGSSFIPGDPRAKPADGEG
ncbi:hypothetical protein [Xanthobacter autotrophicus]|uniref:hypothetical protein n=1 Tax=Xanthobacter autotrophicus TaxID=280 RepID=UPI0024A726A1|nr:hypothetical protein [Xanthobacter autotrophicus]MDI4657240.1 hypothetical protein [Xanthobacter autotrophicus]